MAWPHWIPRGAPTLIMISRAEYNYLKPACPDQLMSRPGIGPDAQVYYWRGCQTDLDARLRYFD